MTSLAPQNLKSRGWSRHLRSVLVAAAAVSAATAVRLLLGAGLDQDAIFATYFVALALVAWFDSLLAIVLTLVFGLLASVIFIAAPTLAQGGSPDALIFGSISYLIAGVLAALLSRSRQINARRADDLEAYLEERKRTEQALQLTAARFSLALRATPIMMFTQDRNLRRTWAYIKEPGISADDVLGRSDHDLLDAGILDDLEEVEALEHLKRQALETGKGTRAELPLHIKGVFRCFDVVVEPMLDEGQQVTGITCAAFDITKLKEAHEEVQQANHRLIAFIGFVIHELRAPVTAIKGFASSLLLPDIHWSEAEQHEFAAIIESEADKLSQRINDLLDISQTQAESLKLITDISSVEEVLRIANPQLAVLCQQHDLHLNVQPELPPIRIDPQRIGQVLVNLVQNAARYSPPHTQIDVNAFQRGRMLHIEVCDQGPGIAPEQRHKVFDPFHQSGKTDAERSGAGLGLAICKGLIEAHGGTIWIEDRPTPGTTITFSLPLAAIPHRYS